MKRGGFAIAVVSIIVLLDLNTAAPGAIATELWREGLAVIPYPQVVKMGGGDFLLGREVEIVLDKGAAAEDRFAARELARRLQEEWSVKGTITERSSGKFISLTRKGAPKKVGDQGYKLTSGADGVTVSANGSAGLYYGTQTLMQLVKRGKTGLYIPGLEIEDWPDIPVRAVHYDTKHHQDKKEYVKSFIRTLSHYKINMLVWEWEDKFAYPSHPEIGAPGAFTMEEMQEFTRYARKYHVQIVPLVQGLGHVSFILKWPQHAHLREIPASNWEFCPLKEGTYKLLFDLWEDAIKATPGSEYIHIGSDETYELGKGTKCGCREKMKEIGRSGLYHLFVGKSARHLMSLGRKVMVWERPMGWERGSPPKKITPPKGLILTESFNYSSNYDYIKKSRRLGYPVFVYVPNPGIEHLFLPYYYRVRNNRVVETCLERSYNTLSPAARAGVFDGMICTSWDDSGLHNQIWMMRFVLAAEYSWSGGKPTLEEFREKYYPNYYGENAMDMPELFLLLNKAGYYYMDTFERRVWHWGEIGKTHLPDLPRDDVEYDPYWNTEYKEMVQRSRRMLGKLARAEQICRANLAAGVKNGYDFEIFLSIIDLVRHTCNTYLALSQLEYAIRDASRAHFVDHQVTYDNLERAARIIKDNLAERERVFNSLVATWEKTRLPKGMSTKTKKFFHARDRARHFANRRPDMTYLIYDEQLLGLEDYLKKLQEYMAWYKKTYLQK